MNWVVIAAILTCITLALPLFQRFIIVPVIKQEIEKLEKRLQGRFNKMEQKFDDHVRYDHNDGRNSRRRR